MIYRMKVPCTAGMALSITTVPAYTRKKGLPVEADEERINPRASRDGGVGG